MADEPPLSDKEKAAIKALQGLGSELRSALSTLESHKARKKRKGCRVKPPRCPKCGLKPQYYIEIWANHTIHFGTDADGRPDDEGALIEGDPHSVMAECPCGHKWRLKGVQQITEIRELFT